MHGIRDTLIQAHRALTDAGIDHALIGGLALGALGVHRATLDADLLVPGSERAAAVESLAAAGFVLRGETPETLHFAGYGALDLLLANRPPTREMLAQATLVAPLGVKCLRAEDIIGLKIQAYVNNPRRALQDQADIAALIERHRDLDWERIKRYADLFSEWPTLARLREDHDL